MQNSPLGVHRQVAPGLQNVEVLLRQWLAGKGVIWSVLSALSQSGCCIVARKGVEY